MYNVLSLLTPLCHFAATRGVFTTLSLSLSPLSMVLTHSLDGTQSLFLSLFPSIHHSVCIAPGDSVSLSHSFSFAAAAAAVSAIISRNCIHFIHYFVVVVTCVLISVLVVCWFTSSSQSGEKHCPCHRYPLTHTFTYRQWCMPSLSDHFLFFIVCCLHHHTRHYRHCSINSSFYFDGEKMRLMCPFDFH